MIINCSDFPHHGGIVLASMGRWKNIKRVDAMNTGKIGFMNRTIRIFLLIGVMILGAYLVEGYVRTDYWECTSLGEQSRGDYWGNLPVNSDAYTSTAVCRKTCCQLCASRYVYQDCWSGDAKTPCQCRPSSTFDGVPPEITISSPVDNAVYNTRDILLNASTNELVQYIKRKIDSASITSMCSSCMKGTFYMRSLAEGTHRVTVNAADMSNNAASKTITFVVDTMPPEIISTRPASGGFVKRSSATFSMVYTESNVVDAKISYRKKGTSSYNQMSISCQSGTQKSCSTNIDLSGYSEGDIIEYYFTIYDASASDSSGVNEVTINTELAEYPFQILSPHNGEAYPKTSQILSINAFFTAQSISYSIDGIKYNIICTNCNSATKSLSLRDGMNTVRVKVTDQGGSEYSQSITFEIDSKPPKIRKTYPKDKSYSNGEFSVEYDEEDLYSMKLYYWGPGQASSENIAAVSGCNSGRAMKCSINADVNGYHGKTISYYFEAKDSANTVKSKTVNTTIDVVKPAISLRMPLTNSINTLSNVLIGIGMDAPVATLEMFDNSGKVRKLCGGCSAYERSIGFKEGRHDVRFVATDYAGNTDEEEVMFYVDSKMPVISSITPSGYTSGKFVLKYSEDNIEAVKLYYKRSTDGQYASATFTSCPSGANKACTLNADLGSYNGQKIDYYAAIEDIAGNIASSKVIAGVMADTSAPVLTINNPISNSYVTTVPLDIRTNELVYLESIDNGNFVTFCTSCIQYVKTRTYTKGPHTVVIRATDKAGNVAETTKSFNIT